MGQPANGHLDKELCITTMLLRRLEDDGIPTLLAMKKKVDREELLTDAEIEHIERLVSEAETFEVARLLERRPEYAHLVGAFFTLCREVIERDLRTESSAHPPAHGESITPIDAATPG